MGGLPCSPLTLKLRMLLPVDRTGYLLPYRHDLHLITKIFPLALVQAAPPLPTHRLTAGLSRTQIWALGRLQKVQRQGLPLLPSLTATSPNQLYPHQTPCPGGFPGSDATMIQGRPGNHSDCRLLESGKCHQA